MLTELQSERDVQICFVQELRDELTQMLVHARTRDAVIWLQPAKTIGIEVNSKAT